MTTTGRTRVTELRVHGVGGTPPENQLGLGSARDLIRVGGESRSGFFARLSDKAVEGYSWGSLTSGVLLQPLWLFLLPFTLVNVSGFMFPPKRSRSMDIAAKTLVCLLGMTVTAVYVVGIYAIVVKYVFLEWALNGLIESPEWRLALGTATMLGLGLLTGRVAHTTRSAFDEVSPPQESFDCPQPSREAPAFCADEPNLGEETFWSSGADRRTLFRLHVAVALITLAWLTWLAMGSLDSERVPLGAPVLLFGSLQALLLLLLLLVHVFGFRRRPDGFRILGPLVGVMTAIVLSIGVFAGLVALVVQALNGFGSQPPLVAQGPELAFGLAWAFASLGFLTMALLLSVFLWGRARREAAGIRRASPGSSEPTPDADGSIPINEEKPWSEPKGLPRHLIGSLGQRRAFSDFLRNLDLLLSAAALSYAPIALLTLFDMSTGGDASNLGAALRHVLDSPGRWIRELGNAANGPLSLIDGFERNSLDILVLAAVAATLGMAAFLSGRHEKVRPVWLAAVAAGGCLLAYAAHRVTVDLVPTWVVRISVLKQVGAWLGAAGTTYLLYRLLWPSFFDPNQRKRVGILWDVLLFWPRRFHPLAVRSYADRAVPELQGRLYETICGGGDERRRVLLAAHSQGSVIAYAALVQIACRNPGTLSDIAFVTVGSPLTQLHSRYFPAYFQEEHFREIAGMLADGTVTIEAGFGARGRTPEAAAEKMQVPIGWRNFYRATDYVGKEIRMAGDADGARNHGLPDPPREPLAASPPEDFTPGSPDPYRSAWVEFSMHSYYHAEKEVKHWLTMVKMELAER